MKFLSEQLSRRAHYEDKLRKNNGTMISPAPSKEKHDSLVLGISSDHVPAAISDRAGVSWKKFRQMLGWDNRMKVLIHQAKNWRRVKKEESIMPENRHVWVQGNRRNPLHQATNVLCRRNGIAHQKKCSGEWVKRM